MNIKQKISLICFTFGLTIVAVTAYAFNTSSGVNATIFGMFSGGMDYRANYLGFISLGITVASFF